MKKTVHTIDKKHIELLQEECPARYKVNEIIPFAYPYRHLKLKVRVSKPIEGAMQELSKIMLRAIKLGLNKQEDLLMFLGLDRKTFLLKELYQMQAQGYVDYDKAWFLTETGCSLCENDTLVMEEDSDIYEFLLDTHRGILMPKHIRIDKEAKYKNPLEDKYKDFAIKDSALFKGRRGELSKLYEEDNKDSVLLEYDDKHIEFDARGYAHYYLVEYTAYDSNDSTAEPYVEIRHMDKHLTKNKEYTKFFMDSYPNLLYELTDSDERATLGLDEDLSNEEREAFVQKDFNVKSGSLSIWETKEQFIEALKTCKKSLLIESPWIKGATRTYIPLIKDALKRGVKLFILYGIDGKNEHDTDVLDDLRELEAEYGDAFLLVSLPKHFKRLGMRELRGTHRKLLIKDVDYYVAGSFNFLSFNKEKGQVVANEESYLHTEGVKEKLETVLRGYRLKEYKR